MNWWRCRKLNTENAKMMRYCRVLCVFLEKTIINYNHRCQQQSGRLHYLGSRVYCLDYNISMYVERGAILPIFTDGNN